MQAWEGQYPDLQLAHTLIYGFRSDWVTTGRRSRLRNK